MTDYRRDMLRRSIRANIAAQPTDPGPGVAEVEEFQRACARWHDGMATQAPEAPIPLDPLAEDPVEMIHLELGGQPSGVAEYACLTLDRIQREAKAEIRRRDALEATLKAEVDWWGHEWADEWDRAEVAKARFKRLIWIAGSVIAALVLALVGLIQGML